MFNRRNLTLLVFGIFASLLSSASSPGCNCDAHARHLIKNPTMSVSSTVLK